MTERSRCTIVIELLFASLFVLFGTDSKSRRLFCLQPCR